jgi:hexosaminidase
MLAEFIYPFPNKNPDEETLINSLLPRPQQIERLSGGFVLTAESVIYLNGRDKQVKYAAARFVDLIQERFHLHLSVKIQTNLDKYQVVLNNQSSTPPNFSAPAAELKTRGDEAHELVVQPNGVRISANSAKGVFWGLMTLTQLCGEQRDNKIKIPMVNIFDYPHYRWRGYMLDTGRAPFTVEQIKRTIRICSAFKLNFLMFREGDDELNAIKYKHLPLGHKNPYALTLEEVAEIIDYGEKYGIVVFPEIESLGHAAAKKLHYPDLIEGDKFEEYWPGFTHMRKANFKVGDPRTYRLLASIYDELFPLLKYPLVHLGLDEVRLPEKKQAEHLARLLPTVDQVGKKYGHNMKMIVWSDAPLTPPEYQNRVIRCLWVYEAKMHLDIDLAKKEGIDALVQPDCKQKVFMAGGSGTLHKPYSKGPYRSALQNLASWAMLGEKYHNFIGLLAVEWGSNVIDEWFPNFLMAADFGWSVPEEIPDYEPYMTSVFKHLQKFSDFTEPDPAAVIRPAWDGIWLNGTNWEEDIITGDKAAPVLEIIPAGGFFVEKSMPIKIVTNFPDAKIYYSIDDGEPNPQARLYYEPFYVKTTTTVKARAFMPGRPPSYIQTQVFGSLDFQDAPAHGQLSPGLHYDYYQTFTYSVLDLRNHEITSSGKINKFAIAPCAEGEMEFGFILRGYVNIRKQGIYTFYILSNDGSKLHVNGRELIDNDGRHGPIEKSGKIALKVGKYPIMVEYFQNGGGQALSLSWSAEWFEKQEVADDVLFH